MNVLFQFFAVCVVGAALLLSGCPRGAAIEVSHRVSPWWRWEGETHRTDIECTGGDTLLKGVTAWTPGAKFGMCYPDDDARHERMYLVDIAACRIKWTHDFAGGHGVPETARWNAQGTQMAFAGADGLYVLSEAKNFEPERVAPGGSPGPIWARDEMCTEPNGTNSTTIELCRTPAWSPSGETLMILDSPWRKNAKGLSAPQVSTWSRATGLRVGAQMDQPDADHEFLYIAWTGDALSYHWCKSGEKSCLEFVPFEPANP